MGQAVGAFLTTAAAYASKAIVTIGSYVGLTASQSLNIAAAIGKFAVGYALTAASAPSRPSPQAIQTTRKDPYADRVTAYGRNRIGTPTLEVTK